MESWFRLQPESLSRVRRGGLFLAKLLYLTLRKLKRDLCFERAASLSFTTTVCLLPLTLLAFSLFSSLGSDGIFQGFSDEFDRSVEELQDWVVRYVADDSADEVRSYLVELRASLTRQASQVQRLALVVLLITVLSLFRSAERSFSAIWNVRVKRGYLKKLGTFWLLLTLAPLILGTSVYVKSTLERTLGVPAEQSAQEAGPPEAPPAEESSFLKRGFQELILHWVFPISISFFAFTLLYIYLPNTRVRLDAAATGALVAAFGWELGTQSFDYYLQNAFLSGVYGALGVVPFFLFWVYFSWFVALFGAEIGYCLQNFTVLEQEVRYHFEEERVSRPVHGLLFLERIYRGFQGDGDAANPESLAREFRVPLSEVEDSVEILVKSGFVVVDADGALTPRQDAARIRPIEVVECFPTGSGYRFPSGVPADTPLRRLLAEVRFDAERQLRSAHLDQLITEPDPPSPPRDSDSPPHSSPDATPRP